MSRDLTNDRNFFVVEIKDGEPCGIHLGTCTTLSEAIENAVTATNAYGKKYGIAYHLPTITETSILVHPIYLKTLTGEEPK